MHRTLSTPTTRRAARLRTSFFTGLGLQSARTATSLKCTDGRFRIKSRFARHATHHYTRETSTSHAPATRRAAYRRTSFFFRFLRVRRKGYGVCHNLHAYRGLPPPNPRSAAARGYSSAARCSLFWRYDPRHAAPRRARTPAQRGGEPHKHECQGSGRGGGRGGARRDGRAGGRAHAGCCCCSSASRRYDPRRAAPRRARTPAQRGEPHEHKCQGSGVRQGGVRGGGGRRDGRAGGRAHAAAAARPLAGGTIRGARPRGAPAHLHSEAVRRTA